MENPAVYPEQNSCDVNFCGINKKCCLRLIIEESGIFPRGGMAKLPRIRFGHERGNLRSTRVALSEVRSSG